MPNQFFQKPTANFVKGLITEAGELSFPEGASVDELNCTLDREGVRGRRQGVKLEEDYVLSDFTVGKNDLVTTHTWTGVGGLAGSEYVVVQVGATVYFYDKQSITLSANLVPVSDADSTVYSLNLSDFEHASSTGAANSSIAVTSTQGYLIVSSPAINTFFVTRDPDTGAFSTSEISFRVRDFQWQGDVSEYSEGEASPTVGRKYDTANVSWSGTKGAAALADFIAAESEYPPLTHAWYSGKNADGDFSENKWLKVYSGTTLISNGKYVLDLYNKDRSTASGIAGLSVETETSRFKTVASYAGRVWYAGMSSTENGSKVFFSKQVAGEEDFGICHQTNDPTSEVISDLLDTDGGVIFIPEAYNISKLFVFGPVLLVFAENGVWSIGGADDIFRATGFVVDKITDVGLTNPRTLVDADGTPVWWSISGIHTLATDGTTGRLAEDNISISTVQSYFDDISGEGRDTCFGVYDSSNKVIYWIFKSDFESLQSKYNEVLVLDLVLKAFYPWKISDSEVSPSFICGAAFFRGYSQREEILDVFTEAGDDVITSGGDDVVSTQTTVSLADSPSLKLLVIDGATSKITFAEFSQTGYLDWGDADYSSYVTGSYDFLGDMVSKKTQPYILVYCRVTETGWVADGNGYSPVQEGSVRLSSFWDFKTTASSASQQAYRLKTTPVIDTGDLDTFGYPTTVVQTKCHLRGRGRVVTLRFESETGKAFKILGFSKIGETNAQF